MKQQLLRSQLGRIWGVYRERQFLANFRRRSEHYARLGIRYDRDETLREVRARIAHVTPRAIGELRVFTFFPLIGWHPDLLAEWQRIAHVTHFDYISRGFGLWNVVDTGAKGRETRRAMNAAFFETLRAAHAEQPFDLVYCYANGRELLPSTLRRIREELGVPLAGMCLDDKNSWDDQVDIAREFDLSWTSARIACTWYAAEGGRALYLPEGFNTAVYKPLATQKDLDVSFVGAAYGFRPWAIASLRRNGIDVKTFGTGWKRSGPVDDAAGIYRRSKINLGMGGIGYTEAVTNVKGRDFEVPATGGGMYLTSFNDDLAQHFEVGREIACYTNANERIEMIRYYLAHDDEREAIARRGCERSWREHQWAQRFETICRAMGIVR